MFLALSAALFAAFFLDVAAGALAGERFLSDLGEALTLLGAAVAFTLAILRREAAEAARTTYEEGGPDAP